MRIRHTTIKMTQEVECHLVKYAPVYITPRDRHTAELTQQFMYPFFNVITFTLCGAKYIPAIGHYNTHRVTISMPWEITTL